MATDAEEPNLVWDYFLPGDLEKQIERFAEHHNHYRCHESMTPADVYFGRGPSILAERESIKTKTIAKRRLHYQRQAT